MYKLPLSVHPKKPKRSILIALCAVLLIFVVAGGTLLTANLLRQAVNAAAANSAVTTYRNNNGQTGQYPNETILNTSNVNSSHFGKRVSYPVDGQMYAQPLYLPNLTIGGKVHNVVFAATENDSVYAFDADQTSAVAPLWKTSLLPSGATAVPYTDEFGPGCGDMQPIIGITGTPVIDSTTNTMYVVADSQENGNEVFRLHALDVTTGLDKSAPIVLQASVPGTGDASSGGTLTFNAHLERQRSALILVGGKVYVAFSSYCDSGDYHGWILSYSYNGSSFQQVNAYVDTPAGKQGGIWGGGGGIISDNNGNIYFADGNGSFNANTGGSDVGDSFVRLNTQLQIQDYFTPFNQLCLQQGDQDLGSGGPMLVPGANALIGGGKERRAYVVNTTSMGKYTADPNLTCNGSAEENRTDIDKVQQEFSPGFVGSLFSVPAFWNGPNGQYVYFSVAGGPTKAFAWSNGKLSTAPTSTTAVSFGFTGGDAVVSSNGTAPGTGILWSVDSGATLRAYDASNLTDELYDSRQVASRDSLTGYVKFTSTAVANGEVFVGTSASLAIFGLLPSGSAPTPTPGSTPTPTPKPGSTPTPTPKPGSTPTPTPKPGSTPTPTPTPAPGAGSVQINAGGQTSGSFVADTGFSGGLTAHSSKTIDTSKVSNPSPQAVYQTNRFGNFSYTIPGLTVGASYTVRLHFAETYWATAGKRVFNVNINGVPVLSNFDILATAGGADIAVVKPFTATASTSGTITIQFITVKDNAQVNGIEVIGSSSMPTPGTGAGSVQINAGGPASGSFVADTDFTGARASKSTHTIDTSGVSNPAPQAVYQTNRVGHSFSYTIPGLKPNTNYTVRLHFAETYWKAAGKRVFNININGQPVLTYFDIFDTAGGANKAVVEQFSAVSTITGTITIQFSSVIDQAQINGIEILS